MRFEQALKLINKYKECPECGNPFIGNGAGGIYIDDDSFKRWCKCGWKVEQKEREAADEQT